MLASLVACAAFATQAPQLDSPRLRTILPNGAAILVEQVPSARFTSVRLLVGTRGLKDETGERHLLEHLLARGDGSVDLRIETAGGFLRAQTLRDAMTFEALVPKEQLALGVEALKAVWSSAIPDQAGIDKELAIIGEELRLETPVSKLQSDSWLEVFDAAGESPSVLPPNASPEALNQLQDALFVPRNVAVVVAGDLDVDSTTATIRNWLEDLPTVAARPISMREPVKDLGWVQASYGEALAVPVASYRDATTAAVLAAALAIASEMDHGFVTYTPSERGGLVILGSQKRAEVKAAVDKADSAAQYELGRDMAKRWVRRQLSDPTQTTLWRGLVLVQSRDLRPETLAENVGQLDYSNFESAMRRWQGRVAQ